MHGYWQVVKFASVQPAADCASSALSSVPVPSPVRSTLQCHPWCNLRPILLQRALVCRRCPIADPTALRPSTRTHARTPFSVCFGAPRYALARDEELSDQLRSKWHIEVDGEDVAPPITNFAGMKYHKAIITHLNGKGITRPTPIQMQGLPVLLSGRDMVGVAFTGSGKTLCFALPLIQFCLEQEKKMPFLRGEGPYGVIMAPSRELARQTYDEINELCQALEDWGTPKVVSRPCRNKVCHPGSPARHADHTRHCLRFLGPCCLARAAGGTDDRWG